MLDALVDAGSKIHPGVFAHGEHVHDKLMIVEDAGRGGTEHFVTTGSDNWGNVSFQRDDVDVKIGLDTREYREYVAFFDRLVHRGAAHNRRR